MKQYFFLGVAFLLINLLYSCKKADYKDFVQPRHDILKQIYRMGYDTTGIVDMGEFYLIEGDIGIKKATLSSTLRRQVYFTNNSLIDLSKQDNITVRVDNSVPFDNSNYDYHSAIPLALAEWNNLGSNIYFSLVDTDNADITIHCQAQGASNLYAYIDDMPTGGYPSKYITINTLCDYGGTVFTDIQKKWIIVHELGHAINIAHTQDYSETFTTKIGYSPDEDPWSVFNRGTAGFTYPSFSYWDIYSVKYLYPPIVLNLKLQRVSRPKYNFLNPVSIEFRHKNNYVYQASYPSVSGISDVFISHSGLYSLKFTIPVPLPFSIFIYRDNQEIGTLPAWLTTCTINDVTLTAQNTVLKMVIDDIP